MKPNLSRKEEKNLYILGWLLMAAGVFLLFFLNSGGKLPGVLSFPCLFYKLTGFYCPGCGGTRAVNALVHGRLWDSFLYHPVVLYVFVIYLWFMISHSIEYISRGKLTVGLRFRDAYLYGAVVVILLQWGIRNVLKWTWGIDIL